MHNLSAAKSTGLCLSAFIDQRCFEGMLELHRDGAVEPKSFETSQSDAFAAPRLRLASAPLRLTAESGQKEATNLSQYHQ